MAVTGTPLGVVVEPLTISGLPKTMRIVATKESFDSVREEALPMIVDRRQWSMVDATKEKQEQLADAQGLAATEWHQRNGANCSLKNEMKGMGFLPCSMPTSR